MVAMAPHIPMPVMISIRQFSLHVKLYKGYTSMLYARAGSPMYRENGENGQKKSLLGKTVNLEIMAKTQGILYAEVVNSLILKIKNNVILAANFFIFFKQLNVFAKAVLHIKQSQITGRDFENRI